MGFESDEWRCPQNGNAQTGQTQLGRAKLMILLQKRIGAKVLGVVEKIESDCRNYKADALSEINFLIFSENSSVVTSSVFSLPRVRTFTFRSGYSLS